MQACEGAGPLEQDVTVLQNPFPVNLHNWMTDNQIDMADCSYRAAERDSVSMPGCNVHEFTFVDALLNNRSPQWTGE